MNATATELVAERQIVQEGFAIALANTVLQSQLLLIAGVSDSSVNGVCELISSFIEGSSGSLIAHLQGDFSSVSGQMTLYFDDNCQRKYMSLDASANGTTTQYTGIDGVTPLATLMTTSQIDDNTGDVAGTGQFTATDGTKASLGLFSNLLNSDTTLPATGLITQDFADLKVALGSTTPLILTLVGNASLTFSGTGKGYSGALGTLAVGPAGPYTLQVNGGTANAAMTVNGAAGSFSLLPAVPTFWTIVNANDDLKFSISVVDNTIRNLVATVTRNSTGAALARATLDQSGTGKITYSDGSTSTISGWVQCGSCNVTGTVVEFYNSILDNYFITSNPAEAAAIDGGSAGPGWARTGTAFNFNAGGDTPVCRFYGSITPGPNSHFYTVSSAECDALKALQASTPASQPRWNFESLDFVSTVPVNGACPAGKVPVYRAYNNGFNRHVDSNHRITANPAGIAAVVARGWVSEGVVMCAPA